MKNKSKLLIIGARGHGRVVADIAIKMDRWKQILFLDDDKNMNYSMGKEVIGKSGDFLKYINEYDIFVAIGNNKTREKIQSQLETAAANIPTLIHPRAIIGEEVEVGIGSVVMAGAVINSGSIIYKGCIVNTGSTVDHDSIIEDYVHISPGAHLAGTVRVGKHTWIGIGATVSNNVKITGGCIIGAGAVVIRNISEEGTYVGVPARRIENNYL